MAIVPRSPETIYQWRDICERVDGPNRHLESLYPVVYYWSSGAYRRDSGPMSGIYRPGPAPIGPTDLTLAGSIVQEQVIAAPVGRVNVIGPDVPYVFTVIDETEPAVQWAVVPDGPAQSLLRLADGQQIFFSPARPVHTVEITAVSPNGASVSRTFGITVQQIVVPPVNHAPTDILLSNLTVLEQSVGAPVGNITVIDADLPTDTQNITCSDPRFVVFPGGTPGTATLQLNPSVQVLFATEPTIAISLTTVDSGGLSITVPFTLTVLQQGGPTDIQLSATIVQEKAIAAPVGQVNVFGPEVPYTFNVVDETDPAVHWVVVPDGPTQSLLRLADGQQIIFSPAQATHFILITATTPTGKFLTVEFGITVQQEIVPPVNNAPTDILLDNLTLPENTNGAIVGNVTVIDLDLPGDTEIITCSDSRFVLFAGVTPGTAVLQLNPSVFVVAATTPTISMTLTATDSSGASVTVPFTLTVIGHRGHEHSADFSGGFTT